MCWICDHPGATDSDYAEHTRRLIATYGWAVPGMARDGVHPPWAYRRAHLAPAELVITDGLTRATQVLNGVAAHCCTRGARARDAGGLLDGPLSSRQ